MMGQRDQNHRVALGLGIGSVLAPICSLLLALGNMATDQPESAEWLFAWTLLVGGLVGALLGIGALVLEIRALFHIRVTGRIVLGLLGGSLGLLLVAFEALQLESLHNWGFQESRMYNDLSMMVDFAHEHYIQPAEYGGGNGAFDSSKGGTTLRLAERLFPDAWATYTIRSFSANRIVIVAIGKESKDQMWSGEGEDPEFQNANGQKGKIQFTLTITPTESKIIQDNREWINLTVSHDLTKFAVEAEIAYSSAR